MDYQALYHIVSIAESTSGPFDYFDPSHCVMGGFLRATGAGIASGPYKSTLQTLTTLCGEDIDRAIMLYGGLLPLSFKGKPEARNRALVCSRWRETLAEWEAQDTLASANRIRTLTSAHWFDKECQPSA